MTEKTLSTIENQYGDEIPAAVLFQENGQLYLWEINCLSSLDYNLGHCNCVNHFPSWEEPISTEQVIARFGKEALDGFEAPSDAQLVFDAFGIEAKELETALRVAYQIGANPLPALRKITGRPIVFSENPDLLAFPEAEPGTVIFVVNSRGEISTVVTVKGRQYEPDPDEEAAEPDLDDPVGMPELAIPAQLD
jgi:hypothetical protein